MALNAPLLRDNDPNLNAPAFDFELDESVDLSISNNHDSSPVSVSVSQQSEKVAAPGVDIDLLSDISSLKSCTFDFSALPLLPASLIVSQFSLSPRSSRSIAPLAKSLRRTLVALSCVNMSTRELVGPLLFSSVSLPVRPSVSETGEERAPFPERWKSAVRELTLRISAKDGGVDGVRSCLEQIEFSKWTLHLRRVQIDFADAEGGKKSSKAFLALLDYLRSLKRSSPFELAFASDSSSDLQAAVESFASPLESMPPSLGTGGLTTLDVEVGQYSSFFTLLKSLPSPITSLRLVPTVPFEEPTIPPFHLLPTTITYLTIYSALAASPDYVHFPFSLLHDLLSASSASLRSLTLHSILSHPDSDRPSTSSRPTFNSSPDINIAIPPAPHLPQLRFLSLTNSLNVTTLSYFSLLPSVQRLEVEEWTDLPALVKSLPIFSLLHLQRTNWPALRELGIGRTVARALASHLGADDMWNWIRAGDRDPVKDLDRLMQSWITERCQQLGVYVRDSQGYWREFRRWKELVPAGEVGVTSWEPWW
ncbi:hypothetical protein BT69DRAFT_1338230 [Atractiella rhizophila]|nr:hypothetical protein BT69DRAFT_1338230 [Atractiella rhizophila]